MECWVAVFTKQNAEKSAYVGIQAAGFPAFYPVERLRVHHRDGERYVITRPLFVHYLFARCDLTLLHKVAEIEGVLDIMRGIDGKPSRVPDGLVEAIRRAGDMGVFDRAEPKRLRDGDTVRIVEGPFAGLIGKIKNARRDRTRFQVVANFVNSMIVPVDNLERITA